MMFLVAAAAIGAPLNSGGPAYSRSPPSSQSEWTRYLGPPTDRCLGPLYQINVQPDETLGATSTDGRVHWAIMVGDRGVEAAACYADVTQLETVYSRTALGSLPRASFNSLERVTQALMNEKSTTFTPAQAEVYLAEVKHLQRELEAKLPAMIVAERRRNPKFPKNTPFISIPIP